MKISIGELKALISEAYEGKWWKNPDIRNPDSPEFMQTEERWEKMAEEPEFKQYVDALMKSADPKELARAKKESINADDEGLLPTGLWMFFYEKRKSELKNMNYQAPDASASRADRILRIRDSSGKGRARKF